MRFYSFTNWMLRPIQQGIQPGHAAVELFVKYRFTSCHRVLMLYNWAENHKTFICLNGSDHANMTELSQFFASSANPYPWASFHEDEQSLAGTLTSVGIVLPPKIYDTAAAVRATKDQIIWPNHEEYPSEAPDAFVARYFNLSDVPGTDIVETVVTLSDWEVQLIRILNSTGLAT